MNAALRARPMTADEIETELRRNISHIAQDPEPVDRPVYPQLPLRAVLAEDGDAFITAAYRSLLGRDPDETGLRTHGASLAAGLSKVQLLRSLRAGDEGRALGRRIGGLRMRATIERLTRLRLIGRPLRILGSLLRIRALIADVRRLQEHTQVQQDGIEKMAALLRAAQADTQSHLTGILQRLDTLDIAWRSEPWSEPIGLLAEREVATRHQLLELGNVDAVGMAIEAIKQDQGWTEAGPALGRKFGLLLRDSERRVQQAEALAESSRRELGDQQRRIGLILEELRRANAVPAVAQARLDDTVGDHLLDALYVQFEDAFRGSRETIRQRQRAHLPLMRDCGAGTRDRPIVDVGTGRGEWLELLRDEGLVARGVDLNAAMAGACVERGLDCVQGDAVAYLAALPEGSVGAVTGFHIIEHLPFRIMVALLDEALRVLKPDGVVMFETPNPANVLVGSRWFYLDPTHRNPLPGEMVAMIAEARGFGRVEIRELHPMDRRFAGDDVVLARQLDKLFHGPQDYALVARKS